MTPIHYPTPPGKAYQFPFCRTSLKFGDSMLLSAQSLTSIRSCATIGVHDEGLYAALLRQLLPYVGMALAEAFPVTSGALAIAPTGECEVVRASQPAYLHAVEEAMTYILAVEQGTARKNKHHALSLFVGYCISALTARVLAGFPSQAEPAWLAVWFLGVHAARAGFVTEEAHTRHVEQMEAARAIERTLPLEVRLGLDGAPLLPTQRVRTPGYEVVQPPLPWPGLLGASLPDLTAFEAAERLGCDLYAERIGETSHAVGRFAYQPVCLTEGLRDLGALLDQVTRAMGPAENYDMTLKTKTGTFRSTSHRLSSFGRVFHTWRPLVGTSEARDRVSHH